MSVNGIQRLQTMSYQSTLENRSQGKDDVERAIEQHQSHVDQAYEQDLLAIEKDEQARETKSGFTLFGAIFGALTGGIVGLFLGSMISGAVGEAANDGAEDAARQAEKESELAGLEVDRAFDRFEDARSELDDQRSRARDVQKFARELRDAGWTGLS